jgi:DNA polymerase III delta prime subunit
MAISFQCKHAEFGSPCKECYARRFDFNIHEINASHFTGKQDIEEFVQSSTFSPMPPSRKRTYILDEAQRLSAASQDLLLKVMEDTPKTTVWITLTTEPSKIVATYRRRCMIYNLRPFGVKEIEELTKTTVEREKLKVKDLEALNEELIRANISSAGLVLMALDKYASGVPAKEAVQGQQTEVNTLRICRAVVKGNLESMHSELKKATADDMRLIRASVAGYLNAILRKCDGNSIRCARAIMQLNEASQADEGLQMPMTAAVLHEITRKFKQ